MDDMFSKLADFMEKHGETIEKIVTVIGAAASLVVEPAILLQNLDQVKQKYEDLENAPRIEVVSQLSVDEYTEYNDALQDYELSVLEDGGANELEQSLKDEFEDLLAGLDIKNGDYVRIDPNEINDTGSGKIR